MNARALNHFARLSEDYAVTSADIVDFAVARAIQREHVASRLQLDECEDDGKTVRATVHHADGSAVYACEFWRSADFGWQCVIVSLEADCDAIVLDECELADWWKRRGGQ